jgi:hypothetical protein
METAADGADPTHMGEREEDRRGCAMIIWKQFWPALTWFQAKTCYVPPTMYAPSFPTKVIIPCDPCLSFDSVMIGHMYMESPQWGEFFWPMDYGSKPPQHFIRIPPFSKVQRYTQTIKEKMIISIQDLKLPVCLSYFWSTCNVASWVKLPGDLGQWPWKLGLDIISIKSSARESYFWSTCHSIVVDRLFIFMNTIII